MNGRNICWIKPDEGKVNDMDRIRNLDRYQKGILLVLIAMALIFAAVYAVTVSREGYLYNDQILEAGTENGNTIYRAEVRGEEWCFTITPEKLVTFRCGEKEYGPYSARLDATAVPKDEELADHMTGVEVRKQDEILFRGGILSFGEYGAKHPNWMLYHEDGTTAGFEIYAVTGNGTMIDGDGKIIDPMEPSVYTILRLLHGPELTHKGTWGIWLAGLFVSLIAAVSILFAEELFRWNLVFRVRNVDSVEPSDWEIASRYIGWTLMVLIVFVIYMMGLFVTAQSV